MTNYANLARLLEVSIINEQGGQNFLYLLNEKRVQGGAKNISIT
jgi:hypothetical protein